ncbi:MAG: anthranilate phosphoribosyltransferase [Syntrophothermus sp.]|uniref:anthranilate phosphoribosyltransferase n=1 Tax=Syntrophothermus sp. TaxID=2736299 RepID=UPI00257A69C4|nr:anthranilate phosphoribosyltransferase [Syntrophothermus sp.]NSW83436.1 anthranilate phosphoribosyltransferase [Syntrophothermus sp.]
MFTRYLKKVIGGDYLTSSEAYEVINLMLDTEVAESQVAALFAALRLRKESGEELFGFARALLDRAIKHEGMEGLLDTCGTGGDGCGTFNVSTAAAIVCAACGVPVAKHGNRAVTSQAGSADVLEALGVRVDLSLDEARMLLEEIGLAFLFAPGFHPVMKHFGPMRRSLGIATAFNFLGPLINPFCPTYQLMGVADEDMIQPVAEALARLGRKQALVVHAENGMDEIAHVGVTQMAKVEGESIVPGRIIRGGAVNEYQDQGVRGGDAVHNARIVREVLAGRPGPAREMVLVNAGAALMVAERAEDLDSGIRMAAEAIESGRAQEKLRQLVRYSQESRVGRC